MTIFVLTDNYRIVLTVKYVNDKQHSSPVMRKLKIFYNVNTGIREDRNT